jgi:hypothetical protein
VSGLSRLEDLNTMRMTGIGVVTGEASTSPRMAVFGAGGE